MKAILNRAIGSVALITLATICSAFSGKGAAPHKLAQPKSGHIAGRASGAMTGLSLAFVPNHGQWDPDALFLARSKGLNWWLTSEGMVMDFYKIVPGHRNPSRQPGAHPKPDGTIKGNVLRFSFVGATQSAAVGLNKLNGTMSFFLGNDKTKWAGNVPRFGEATSQPYTGIATRYYFDGATPRYDLIVSPGADPSQAALAIDGAQSIKVLDNGNVQIGTPYGPIVQKGLVAYQMVNGEKTEIPCQMKADGSILHFAPGSYDRSKTLVIDPLLGSTYLGGSDFDEANGLCQDSNVHIYVVGYTLSTNFPTTSGAYQRSENGTVNAFLSRFTQDLTQLNDSTLIGGSDSEEGYSVVADNNFPESVYIAGLATSSNFPTTGGVYQASLNGSQNVFVCKLPTTFASLTASTLVGGNGVDGAFGMCLDSSNNICFTGITTSTSYPTTSGAYQTANNSSTYTAFVSKLSNDLTTLMSSTYLGGNNTDSGQAVRVDSSGNFVLCGFSQSSNFPTTAGAYQPALVGTQDMIVAKVSSDAKTLVDSTYLGSGDDGAYALALNSGGQVFLGGFSGASGFPTTAGAFQPTLNGGANAVYCKLSANLSTLVASTFCGGSGGDIAYGIGIDSHGNAVLGGYTSSSDFPVTPTGYQTTFGGGLDAFVTRISGDATTLVESTFLGGSSSDAGNALIVDSSGQAAYIAGYTSSNDYPTTVNAYQTSRSGTFNAFVSWYEFFALSSLSVEPSVTGGYPFTFSLSTNATAPADILVDLSNNGSVFYDFPSTLTIPNGSSSVTSGQIGVHGVDNYTDVNIYGTYLGTQVEGILQINPATLQSVSMLQSSVVGGGSIQGEVVLHGQAGPSGKVVSLSSSDPSLTVPASVKVGQNLNYAYFTATAGSVSTAKNVTVSATLGSTTVTSGMVAVGTMTLAGVKTTPATTPGGTTVTGEVWFGQNVSANTVVNLSSSNTGVATVPASVTVDAGADYATFPVTTLPIGSSSSANIIATIGSSSQQANLVVTAATLAGVKTTPNSVTGGASTSGEVWFGQNLTTGSTVTLASNSAAASVPPSVSVSSGSDYATFKVTTTQVTASTILTISASVGATTVQCTLTVNPLPLAGVKTYPTSVVGGASAAGEVWFAQNVSIETTVSLSSFEPLTTVPPSVNVSTGTDLATFTVTTTAVVSTTDVTITATYGGSTVTCVLVVNPPAALALQLTPTGGDPYASAALCYGLAEATIGDFRRVLV